MNSPQLGKNELGNLVISVPFYQHRNGKRSAIVSPEALDGSERDDITETPLMRAIIDGHKYYGLIESGEATNVQDIAQASNMPRSKVGRLIRLVNLAPDIVKRIFANDIPTTLTLEKLKGTIPNDWQDQRKLFLNE